MPVILAVVDVALGIVPYFATATIIIEMLKGTNDLSFYALWCLISANSPCCNCRYTIP